jgi:hypothetical protein
MIIKSIYLFLFAVVLKLPESLQCLIKDVGEVLSAESFACAFESRCEALWRVTIKLL